MVKSYRLKLKKKKKKKKRRSLFQAGVGLIGVAVGLEAVRAASQ